MNIPVVLKPFRERLFRVQASLEAYLVFDVPVKIEVQHYIDQYLKLTPMRLAKLDRSYSEMVVVDPIKREVTVTGKRSFDM